MTLIVGVVSPNGIVIGSDSQTTIGTELKRINKQKPKVTELNNKCIVFAGAGYVSVLQEVEDKVNLTLQDCLPEQGIEAVRDKIDDTIYNVIRKHVSKHSMMFGNLNNMPSGDFLFGSWKGGVQLLCHFGLDGSSEKVDDYIALGSGLPYAEVLLKDLYRPNMLLDDLKNLVYSVIRNTEDIDNYVGGNIHIKIINPDGRIETIEKGEILALAKNYEIKKEIEKELNLNWQEMVPKILALLDKKDRIEINDEINIPIKDEIESNKKASVLIEMNKKEDKFNTL